MSSSEPDSRRLTGSPVVRRRTLWPRFSSSGETRSASSAAPSRPGRGRGATWAMESGSGAGNDPRLVARVGGDELLGLLARLVVGALRVRRLHQVARGPVELSGDAVVEGQLDQP